MQTATANNDKWQWHRMWLRYYNEIQPVQHSMAENGKNVQFRSIGRNSNALTTLLTGISSLDDFDLFAHWKLVHVHIVACDVHHLIILVPTHKIDHFSFVSTLNSVEVTVFIHCFSRFSNGSCSTAYIVASFVHSFSLFTFR